jgi:pimeloyl-ACP methyl ester carboxylesterase
MRAVVNYGDTLGFTTDDPMIVGTGYSGGAIATGWAASLHSTYASELNVQGWVQGGTPSNLTGTLLTLDGTVFAGFGPAAVVGLARPSAYETELTPLLDEILTDAGEAALDFAAENCAVGDLAAFLGQSLLSTEYQTLGPALLQADAIVDVLGENVMGAKADETPIAPVLVYHATQDEIIPYSNASTMVDSWCNNGADVTFTTYAAGGHATTEIIALVEAVTFVEDLFAGNIASGCSSSTVLDDSLDPLALGLDLEPILTGLIDALLMLGAQDSKVENNVQILNKTVDI